MSGAVHGIFLLLGLITVGCVLLITVYLVISGIPAIRKIGLVPFLFGKTWASTARGPVLRHPAVYPHERLRHGGRDCAGRAGWLSDGGVSGEGRAAEASRRCCQAAVSLLAGIPSVVYGLVGMLILVPGIRKIFGVPDGASLLAAMIVLAIMILPSIIKVSVTALEAVPPEYEDASLALGATAVETWFRVSVPAAQQRHRGGGRARRRPRHRRSDGRDDGQRQRTEHAEAL